jgi:hypothetical protein
MPTPGVSTGTLEYAAVREPERRWWKTVLGGVATLANGTIAVACIMLATGLAPQFGDDTSRNSVVVPLVLWKLPLLIAATMLLALGTRRLHRRLGRLSFAFAWAAFAVWTAVAFLLFRP